MSEHEEIGRWWRTGIIYQIYPLSFQDSNGDGMGDLPGVLRRFDYLAGLGVTVLWLSPVFPSPMHDFGYDVANYCAIHPWFGTLPNFDRLVRELHARGIRLLLDLVPNHTSDEHPWFVASRSRRDDPHRDWYIWRDPASDGGPPNNWLSLFGGPAWTFDEATGQYYLHQFTRQQPELNYEQPAVLNAMLAVMRFWLDRGVDGFRVDVIWLLKKDPQLRDEPLNPEWDGLNPHGRLLHIHTADQAATHQVVRAMRGVLDEYGDRLLLGETNLPEAALMAYYGSALDECQLAINFRLIYTPWQAGAVRAAVERYERLLPQGAWPNWVLGNHDQHRLATRVGPWQHRVALMLLLTLRGTPTCYYGDELGLENVPIPFSRMKDPQALNQPQLAETMSRDPARSPMPWDGWPNAGFCPAGVEPWLPLADGFTSRNVTVEGSRADSALAFFRRLTALRQQDPALMSGDYLSIDPAPVEVFAYRRCSAFERRLVVLNFGCGGYRLDFGAWGSTGRILLGTGLDRSGAVDFRVLVLRPNEGLLLQLV